MVVYPSGPISLKGISIPLNEPFPPTTLAFRSIRETDYPDICHGRKTCISIIFPFKLLPAPNFKTFEPYIQRWALRLHRNYIIEWIDYNRTDPMPNDYRLPYSSLVMVPGDSCISIPDHGNWRLATTIGTYEPPASFIYRQFSSDYWILHCKLPVGSTIETQPIIRPNSRWFLRATMKCNDFIWVDFDTSCGPLLAHDIKVHLYYRYDHWIPI